MGAILAANDILEIQYFCYMQGQAAVNTTHWLVTTVTNTVTTKNIADLYSGASAPEFKAIMVSDAAFLGVKVARIDPLPRTAADISQEGAGNGTAGTDPVPRQVCGVISTYTDFAGPSGRGRIYVPFPATVDVNGTTGAPAASYVTKLQDLADDIFTTANYSSGGNTATLIPVIWHRNTRSITPILTKVARGKFGTQRRRGDYGKADSSPL